jgi:hypothetical protein
LRAAVDGGGVRYCRPAADKALPLVPIDRRRRVMPLGRLSSRRHDLPTRAQGDEKLVQLRELLARPARAPASDGGVKSFL